MSDCLEFSFDKFTFHVAGDRLYSREGMWLKPENDLVRIGISDFLQQRSGDMAFVELKEPGTQINTGQEIAVLETIKVNISLSSPISGTVVRVNAAVVTSPELINQDPFHAGWLATFKPLDWNMDKKNLLEPRAYIDQIKGEAEAEK